MHLRDHPLMFHNGIRSWPPMWVRRIDDPSKQPFEGDDFGTLTQISMHALAAARLSLRMKDRANEYAAHVLLDDKNFCLLVYTALKNHVGKPVKDIGDIEME